MYALYETLQEEYWANGRYQTRECYPWEYDVKAQECLQMAINTTSEECTKWFQQQAQICQERAAYIRYSWAKQEVEKQARQEALKQAEQARKEADERWNQLLATMRAWQATQKSTQQSTPPAPHEALKEQANLEENAEITAEMQEQEPLHQKEQLLLYQATVEHNTETIAKSIPDSPSTLSTKIRLCTTPFSGDPAACLSNAPLSTYHYALNLTYQHALILGLMFNTLLGYIRCMEGMEATG